MTSETKSILISKVEDEFNNILKIVGVYAELKGISDYVLDLQIYKPRDEHSEKTESRIWLTTDGNSINSGKNLGINLMLYSINLKTFSDGIATDEEAIEIFAEYQKYFAMNQDKFVVKHYNDVLEEEVETKIYFKFEISPRGF